MSYTQYEWLYAGRRGIKTWLLFTEDGYPADRPPEGLDLPADPGRPDAAEYRSVRRQLQADWRTRLRGESNLRYAATTPAELELQIERLKEELAGLGRSFRTWQRAVLIILGVLIALGGRLRSHPMTGLRCTTECDFPHHPRRCPDRPEQCRATRMSSLSG